MCEWKKTSLTLSFTRRGFSFSLQSEYRWVYTSRWHCGSSEGKICPRNSCSCPIKLCVGLCLDDFLCDCVHSHQPLSLHKHTDGVTTAQLNSFAVYLLLSSSAALLHKHILGLNNTTFSLGIDTERNHQKITGKLVSHLTLVKCVACGKIIGTFFKEDKITSLPRFLNFSRFFHHMHSFAQICSSLVTGGR